MTTKPKVAIACQGGGSHAAFSAGALCELLERPLRDRFDLVGLSGTSGGAICAALAWSGLISRRLNSSSRGPIDRLLAFWRDLEAATPFQAVLNYWSVWSALRSAHLTAPVIRPGGHPMTRSAINEAAKTYAGLDVSLKETAICVVDDAGKIIFERSVATDPQVIAKYLAKHALGLERFGLESGSTSAWLWREFRNLGLPVVCLDSRHAHRVLSMKRNKNDRNDARGLADLVRMGWYREARVRSIDSQFIRSMLLSRQQLLQSRRAIENQIRGALKTLGVMTGPTKGRGFMPRVTELRADNDWLGPVLDPLIAAHASIAKQLKVVSASVLDAAREDADVRRMMTVPGIGAMTALAFKAAIDDPKRFTSSTKVGPYLGLTPRQYQSGESEWITIEASSRRSPS